MTASGTTRLPACLREIATPPPTGSAPTWALSPNPARADLLIRDGVVIDRVSVTFLPTFHVTTRQVRLEAPASPPRQTLPDVPACALPRASVTDPVAVVVSPATLTLSAKLNGPTVRVRATHPAPHAVVVPFDGLSFVTPVGSETGDAGALGAFGAGSATGPVGGVGAGGTTAAGGAHPSGPVPETPGHASLPSGTPSASLSSMDVITVVATASGGSSGPWSVPYR